MAAPTGNPESEILSRLEVILDDEKPAPADPEKSQETKEEPIATKPEGAEEEPVAAVAEEDVKPEAEAEAEPEVKVDAVTEDDDTIHTFSDLAKAFEVEETELLDHLEVDPGDGNLIPLSRVLASYKNSPEATRDYDALKVERAQFQQEAVQLRAKTDEQVRELAVHAQVLLDITQEEFKDVNWKQLEAEDPSQYLILKERQRERGQLIQNAILKLKTVEQERSGEATATVQQNRSAEIAKLHVKMPDWAKPEVAQAAMQETNAFLTEAGFSPEEINAISDHRYLLVAYEAAQYRKLKKQAPKKMEKLRVLPKPKSVLRSTARRDTSGEAQRNAQKKFDRLKETGDERDAAQLFEGLF